MALMPIFMGAFRSITAHKEQKENSAKTGEKPETMTQKDAMMFPIIASFALSHMLSPLVLKLVPSAVPVIPFHLKFTQGSGDTKEAILDYEFDSHDLVCLSLCSVVGVWYLLK